VKNGRIPCTRGDTAAKWLSIDTALKANTASAFGFEDAGLDERVVEYPWVFHRLSALHTPGTRILDAGSVLNHPRILAHCRRAGHVPLSIVTLRYEGRAEVSDAVRYEFEDLRALPYRDGWFPLVISLSTLEHVGLDNSGYGDTRGASRNPSAEAIRAMQELRRVTAPGGTALVSVPFGARSNRGWLRVLDAEDIDGLTRASGWKVEQATFYRAMRDGWRECSMQAAETAGFNDPRRTGLPGTMTAPSWVAAAEAVALLELTNA
jgi:SAM-dependent methyltransferase